MFKKTLIAVAFVVAPMTVLVGCGDGLAKRTVDNESVKINDCDTAGWRHAKEIKANRTYYVCGGNECELEYKVKSGKRTYKREVDIPTPSTISAPIGAKGIRFEDCGQVYSRGAK